MPSLKVYLQYPWKFPDSPYYKYLVSSPPEGIEFLNTKKQRGVITNKRFFWFSNFLKRNIRRWANKLNLVIPNTHSSPKGNYDLIHCAHCLSKNKIKPWVADIESWWSMGISGTNTKKCIKKIKGTLMHKNCKKIMPWTEHTKKQISMKFPEIKDKIEIVYPAIPGIKNLKKSKNRNLRIIFIARYFYLKGGLIALEVLEKLRQKYRIEGILVSNVPENLKKKYSKLKIYNLIPQKKLFELMESSDIFLYPSFADTFGFSLLEAMSFGLPIISINTNKTKTRKEIVEDGKTGLIFDVNKNLNYYKIEKREKEVINKLILNASKLIKNKKFKEEMSKNCVNIIKNGKFSIKERNKKLREIYSEAIKK